jgi:hypothetical protein
MASHDALPDIDDEVDCPVCFEKIPHRRMLPLHHIKG